MNAGPPAKRSARILHLGRFHRRLSDRRRRPRGRARARASGTHIPGFARQDRKRRYRRRYLRSLSPLPRRRRVDAKARDRCLPVLGGVAADHAERTRRHQRSRARLLRPADRRGSRRRHRAVAVSLSLGSAASAARQRRLDQPRLRGLVRGLHKRRRPPLRRSRQAVRDLQRAERVHAVRFCPWRPGSGNRRPQRCCCAPSIT